MQEGWRCGGVSVWGKERINPSWDSCPSRQYFLQNDIFENSKNIPVRTNKPKRSHRKTNAPEPYNEVRAGHSPEARVEQRLVQIQHQPLLSPVVRVKFQQQADADGIVPVLQRQVLLEEEGGVVSPGGVSDWMQGGSTARVAAVGAAAIAVVVGVAIGVVVASTWGFSRLPGPQRGRRRRRRDGAGGAQPHCLPAAAARSRGATRRSPATAPL